MLSITLMSLTETCCSCPCVALQKLEVKAERDSVEETTLDSSTAEAPQERQDTAEGELEFHQSQYLLLQMETVK